MKKRRLFLLLLWILSLIAISFYGGTISYGLFFCVSLVPVISIIYLLSVFYRFRIYQEIQSRNITCKHPVPYHMALQNDSHIPFVGVSVVLFSDFSNVKKLENATEFELYPGERHLLDTELLCKYRGEYEVGVREVILTDFFRIIRLHYRLPSTIKALVLPRILRLEALQSIPDIAARLQQESIYKKNQPDIPVRDYIAGDSLKQIHWKSTAREQKLKTRTQCGEEKQGLIIFCDTHRYGTRPEEYLPLENQILEAVLALSFFFASKNIPFTLLWSQKELQQQKVDNLDGYDALFQRIVRVLFSETENPAIRLRTLCDSGLLYRAKTILIVLHELNDDIIAMTEQLTSAGTEVVLYLITDQDTDTYTRQHSIRCKIITVPVQADLERLL